MSGDSEPVYLVNASADPIIIRVHGRASYMNCAPFGEFLQRMSHEQAHSIIIDFQLCEGMDSTFLGMIAGAAMELRKKGGASMTLCNLSERNLELVMNLGLHRILNVDEGEQDIDLSRGDVHGLSSENNKEVANAKMILKAHENLVEADESNQKKFQDVISFLKNQVDDLY